MHVAGIEIEIERKTIKNVHLAVYPPNARVHVSSPIYLSDDDIRCFVVSKLEWIKAQQKSVLEQDRQTERKYVSGENHYLFGKRYMLIVNEINEVPGVREQHNKLYLNVRPGSTTEKKAEVIREWQRANLQRQLDEYIAKWCEKLKISPQKYQVKKMKNLWGSCNQQKQTILFNLELARVPRKCIEYIVVHELTHLQHRLHNQAFINAMDNRLPNWKILRQELNDFVAQYLNIH